MCNISMQISWDNLSQTVGLSSDVCWLGTSMTIHGIHLSEAMFTSVAIRGLHRILGFKGGFMRIQWDYPLVL